MLPSVRVFLSGLIDYAGLFPPAKLPLEPALRNYAQYRTCSDAWMLGRFIIPATRLGELEPFAELFNSGEPWAFAVLGRGGSTHAEFLAGLKADLDAINIFCQKHGERVAIDVIETRLPLIVEGEDEALFDLSEAVDRLLESSELTPFFEASHANEETQLIGAINFAQVGLGRGFKLRCGGLDAAAFPTTELVATALTHAADCAVPLKCTAGLHHPVRHFNSDVQTRMHGFLNVFGAAILADSRRIPEAQVRAILEDEDPTHFRFDETGFSWQQYQATVDEISTARAEFATSFGSCSFDEPRDDLRNLGLLS
jgi:hypothetical protein